MNKLKMSKEEREGVIYSVAIHGFLLILAFFVFVGQEQQRYAYLEVNIGDFKDGSPSEFSLERPEMVATSPNPSPVDPVDPKPIDQVKPVPEAKKEVTKPVEAPKQTQKLENEIIKTPETKQISPQPPADRQRQQAAQPPRTQQAPTRQDGAERSGDVRGTTGQMNTQQGTANDPTKSAPFSLKWDGDIVRSPMSQPLPNYVEDVEAVITVRFQVMPNGSINQIIPLRKMSPALEKEVMATLRSWRFQRLPSGVPQEPQWGTITFRFTNR